MTDALSELTDLLRELPGIGPRQARRLAYWLVRRDKEWVRKLADTLIHARRTVRHCSRCMRMFPVDGASNTCGICSNPKRDANTLLVVEKDVDLENIERTGVYEGLYFVLGGTTSPLDKEPQKRVRIQELTRRLQGNDRPNELVLAVSATTEGEDTAYYIAEQLASMLANQAIKLTRLGRGLSTGTELEYVDADTMKSAFKGRM